MNPLGHHYEVSLAHARAAFTTGAVKGTTCPCCDRYGKKYRRSLNAGMAYFLVRLARITKELQAPGGWVYIKTITEQYGIDAHRLEHAKLAWWQLIESFAQKDAAGRKFMWWRLTQWGWSFVNDQLLVPKRAWEFDGVFCGFDDVEDRLSIRDALKEHFDYAELMTVAVPPPYEPRKRR